jgi:hypothetical protein
MPGVLYRFVVQENEETKGESTPEPLFLTTGVPVSGCRIPNRFAPYLVPLEAREAQSGQAFRPILSRIR